MRSLRWRRTLVLIGLLLLGLARTAGAAEELAARIGAVIDGPDYREAQWGILVVDAETGQTVYAHNPEKLFAPASTTKLFSCAAALATLGADYKFETPVYRTGPVLDGRLLGDLVLVASGDLTLGGRTDAHGNLAFTDHDHIYANGGNDGTLTDTDPLAGLKSLAHQIAEMGIRRVEGEVLVDDRLFMRNRGTGSGPDLLTPIMVNDNVVDALVRPAEKVGEPAQITMRPETSYVQLEAQVSTVAAEKTAQISIEATGPHSFVVRGQIPLGGRPLVRIFAVEDPTAFARALFIEALRREGVAVPASVLKAPPSELPVRDGYEPDRRVALFTSPPLSEALKVTLKVSHNLYASTLPLLVAVKHKKRTLADGLRLEGQALADLGVEVRTISFGGGAGGANADAVTPRATVQLLQAMSKRPDYGVYRDALPVLGVDGTLAEAVAADSPARGKVQAKTGTLFWGDLLNGRSLLRSKALAGTMTTASGRTLFLALFVNDVPLPRGVQPTREGKVLGKLCEILYQDGP
jgi:D-alanyl-D-alanine carboxypeptidase/D-alanyl-D-alanine-endopeptidase (penicillin-binding protein 4)